VVYKNSDGLKMLCFSSEVTLGRRTLDYATVRLSHNKPFQTLPPYTESPQDMTDSLRYFRYIIGQLKEKPQGSRGVEAL
jgi:hypothetical protein